MYLTNFWGDFLLAGCYLINQLRSSVLHGGIPYSLLYPNKTFFYKEKLINEKDHL